MTYTPLTLKDVPRSAGYVGKAGLLHRQDGSTVKVSVRPHENFYAVYTDGKLAGLVHKLGIGRYGIQSYGADNKAHENYNQPRGYEHRSTLAIAVERVAHEHLNNVEYAAEKAGA